MDEEMDTSVDTSDIPDDIPADVPEDIPEDIPDDIPEDVPEDIPEDEPSDVDDDIPEDVPEDIPEDEPSDVGDDIPEDVPEDIPEDEPSDVGDDIPEDVSEDIPEEVPAGTEEADEQPTDAQDDVTDDPAAEAEEAPADAEETDEQPTDAQDGVTDDPAAETEEAPTDAEEADEQPTDDPAEAEESPEICPICGKPKPCDCDIHETEDSSEICPICGKPKPCDCDTHETDDSPEICPVCGKPKPCDCDLQETEGEETPVDSEEAPADTQKKSDADGLTKEQLVGTNEPSDLPGTPNQGGLDTSETEPDAFSKLSDYMNAHNYGPQDFNTYSQDPEWRNLHRAAFPDYEMPPLTQENAMGQLYDFMNSHGYGPNDLEEYSQNPVWRELQSAAFPDYELPEYDDSKEAQALRDLGVPNVDLRGCNPEYRSDVVNAVKDAFNEYPELKDQLSKINCHDMNDGTYASYGPTSSDSRFGGCLNLNSKYFSSDDLPSSLAEESKQGWSVPNASPQSIVSHELGHGMHLDLCAQDCGLEYGKVPDSAAYNSAVQQYMDDVHADKIVQDACDSCGVDFDSWDFADQLTRYGASNYGEALAEAVAEVRNNDNPRPMAQAIYSNLMNYKK